MKGLLASFLVLSGASISVEPRLVSVIVVAPSGVEFKGAEVTFERGESVVKLTLDPRGRASGPVPTGTWRIGCEGPGVFCPPILWPGKAPSVTLAGLAKATVWLDLEGVDRVSSPLVQASGAIQMRPGESSDFEYRTNMEFVRGRWSCTVPSTKSDLRLSAVGFVPIYWWDLDIGPQGRDLGSPRLRTGSSVLGTALNPDGKMPAAGVTLHLDPIDPPSGGGKAQLLRHTVTTSERGLFQFAGILSARYRLSMIRGGRLIGSFGPIVVPPDNEVRLEEVRVVPSGTARLFVTPPNTPSGGPWHIALTPLETSWAGVPLDLSARTLDGEGQVKGLPPGRYRLAVRDERGSPFLIDRIDITGDIERTLDLPISKVRGRVRLGGKPLKAEVKLLTEGSSETRFTSDDEGRFEGVMRTPRGTLLVDVAARDPRFHRRLTMKSPGSGANGEEVDLEIDLKDKVVSGRVVMATGRPAPDVEVVASAGTFDTVSTLTAADGTFELRAADAARYSLSLTRRGVGVGQTTIVDLTERDAVDVELTIGLYRKGLLRVEDAEGNPAPGTRLTARAIGFGSVELLTDSTGSASLAWPEGAPPVAFVRARSPNAPAISGCVTIDLAPPELDLSLRLPSLPGSRIRVVREESEDKAAGPSTASPSAELLLVSARGGVWRVGEEVAISRGSGFEAGEYALAWNRTSMAEFLDSWCAGPRSPTTPWRKVVPGEELELRLPPQRWAGPGKR